MAFLVCWVGQPAESPPNPRENHADPERFPRESTPLPGWLSPSLGPYRESFFKSAVFRALREFWHWIGYGKWVAELGNSARLGSFG